MGVGVRRGDKGPRTTGVVHMFCRPLPAKQGCVTPGASLWLQPRVWDVPSLAVALSVELPWTPLACTVIYVQTHAVHVALSL